MYDILVKGGEVIDPAQGIHAKRDIGISAGKIAAVEAGISADRAKEVIDAKGKLVVPGLIDVHGHPAGALLDVGVYADDVGIRQGVTTVCDGGSLGCANFRAARPYINALSRTDVFWFIHGGKLGLVVSPELQGSHEIDRDGTLRVIEENRDIIRGVKFRAIGRAAQTVGLEGAKAIKGIATDAGLPLMVHLGICGSEVHLPDLASDVEPYTKDVLRLLGRGDIVTHMYSPKVGGVIQPDGRILPEFREAIERGVLLDVAHGGTNFGLEIARVGIANGILPHTISTDVSSVGIAKTALKGVARIVGSEQSASMVSASDVKDPAFSLAAIMSKFLALGFSLDQVIEMTTINPARILTEEQRRGSLKIGMNADVTILQFVEREVLFPECTSDLECKGKAILIPKFTVKSRENRVDVTPVTAC
jgi:dihydroorotase